MEMKEIIKIIKTKENWNSEELINEIKIQDKKIIRVDFCHIGGYELMRDGTRIETCNSLNEIQDLLKEYGIDFDETIKDPIKLVKSILKKWKERWDDGGGSGWIDY